MDAASAILTFIHASRKIYRYAHDVVKAKEEQAIILSSIQAIQTLLDQIATREAAARQNPSDPWYQGLLALRASATLTSSGKALVPLTNGKGDGALDRLAQIFRSLEEELEPRHGLAGVKQRWLWAHDKKTIKDAITEFERLRALLDSILLQDHFKLDLDTNNRVQGLERTGAALNDHILDIKATGATTVSHLQDLHDRGSENSSRLISLVDSNTGIKSSIDEIKLATDATNKRLKRLEDDGTKKALQEERKAIIDWLSPLQYRKRQSEILDNAIPLGQRFLGSEEFRAWSAGRSWWLYGYGLPGSGKTVLSSIVVHQLQKRHLAAHIPVLCVYLNYKEPNQTIRWIIGSLLKQLVQFADNDLKSPEVQRLFRDASREAPPLLDDLYRALKAEILTFSRVVIVVDALDEASAHVEAELLDKLHDLPPEKLSVMITSRPRDDIFRYYPTCKECQKNSTQAVSLLAHKMSEPSEVSIDIEPTDDDIHRYIQHELKHELELGKGRPRNRRFTSSRRGTTRLGRICQEVPELQDMIPKYILASANGMFMLAKLYISAIKVKTSPEEVKDALEALPQGYDDSYKATMERIEATSLANPNDTSSSLAKRALMWVVCSYRPLSLAELQEALAIDIDKPDSRSSYRYDKETLLEITAGLLYVNGDETSVNLCHTTALEYFNKTQATWFPNPASKIARCCLQYLGRPELAESCVGIREDEEFEKRTNHHPFLAYAYSYWGNHAYDARPDTKVQDAVIHYLEDSKRLDSFVQAAWYLHSTSSASWDIRKGATSLHVAAWFGLTEAVTHLLDQGLDVDTQDPADGLTPLILACRCGKAETVELLLSRGASINVRNHSDSTALFDAVIANQPAVMAVLLRNPKLNVNEEHLHNSERTALMFAAKDDYLDVLGNLLDDPRIKVNKKDLEGSTALIIAAKAGNTDSVRRLLKHNDIDIDSIDQNRCSALIHAARNGWDEIVEQLLSKGANPSIKDQDGGTALLRAIDNGHSEVVQIMLERSIADIHDKDFDNRTFLHGAAVNGYAEISKLLVGKGLDKDTQDNQGRTPLHDASRNGKAEAVTTLLALGANAGLKDKYDRTPWDVAWQNIQPQTMLILSYKPSDTSSVQSLLENYPNINALPIWSLARLGKPEFLTSALKSRPESLYHLDPDTDNTALHTAVLANHPHLLEILLEAGLSPSTPNAQFRTPLHLAVLQGSVPCTCILLAPPCTSPSLSTNDNNNANLKQYIDSPDGFHQTPLLIAQIRSHLEISLLLIEAGAEIDPSLIRVQALFFAAVEFARPGAVRKLLAAGASVVEKNAGGKTALGVAKERLVTLGTGGLVGEGG
ncbi:MAG: hypothetical protein Q9188_007253, partial [Gyalolechia gomerana]